MKTAPASTSRTRRRPTMPRRHLLAAMLALALGPAPAFADQPGLETDLADLSLEQLSQIRVTSVSKESEQLLGAAASVYVISRDDIRRAGATSIPEALRLAPGVEVARNGAHSWAISIRGFNNDTANKLLVLIDGRSVYSPLYAGVFWDVQDTLLEDIDRIEVVSGPGGTLWGANAVNGVINIITRSAKDSQGGFVQVGGGDEERAFAGFRYGGRAGGTGWWRAYAKSFSRDASAQGDGSASIDAWRMTQAGFRSDWQPTEADQVTVQGDLYHGSEDGLFRGDFTLGTLPGPSVRDRADLGGGNLLGRWRRQLAAGGDVALQAYFDHTERDLPNTFDESRDTVDFDFQHHPVVGGRHDLLWGAGFRLTRDHLTDSLFANFTPDRRSDRTYSAFVQDRIDLWQQRLFLTLGSKFEHNDYTGFETQPNVRLTWLASPTQTWWAAASRAVRIPARLDADLTLTAPISIAGLPFPVYVNVFGNHDFDSEVLRAYEAGYRAQAGRALTVDVAVFYNEYDQLQTTEPALPQVVVAPPIIYIVLPNYLRNGMKGQSHGGTVALDWQPRSNWRLKLNYTYFEMHLRNKPGSVDASALGVAGDSPRNQVSLASYLDVGERASLYTAVRHVDALPHRAVPGYTALDLGWIWHLGERVDLSVHGLNLTHARHAEFNASGNLIERSAFVKLDYRF